MTPVERELMMRIWAGYQPFHDVTARLYHLEAHFPKKKIEAALSWLVRNGLTGKKFVDWFHGDCNGSQLEMHRILLARITRTKEVMPVYIGKDFRA